MHDLLAQIPMRDFAIAMIFWVLGIMTAWRFARYVERLRDAVTHARHHYGRAVDFLGYARNNIVGFALTAIFFVAVVGVVGWLAVVRITG